ncbi:DUF7344 domain-containing protein [Halobacterium yunchengense]|uniref:DUF7344 domain-containing protein n=1 Tax=Halobacterium yunchengense TaxID=3108497 RepID=UPI00300ACDCD
MLEATQTGGESGPDAEPEGVGPPAQPTVEGGSASRDDADELPLDVTFEILKNRRRRLVLQYVRDTDEPTTIGELAEHIAAIENDTTVQQLNAQQRKRVYIGLYQCHLPKMDDAGVVAFNQDRGRIEPGPNVEPLYDYLDVGAEEPGEDPVGPVHVGGSIAFASLFFLAQFVQAYAVATGVVVVFLVAVLAFAYRSTRTE